MKTLIFAGGGGKRFWPLSRDKNPKQFVKVVGKHSTFQLMIRRIQPVYGWHNIYVSANEKYISKIKEEEPEISTSNIFAEPARRDVGPAAALALLRLKKMGVTEPVGIFWADQFIKQEKAFHEVLKKAESLILKKKSEVVLIGEKPTFANMNFGWIEYGNEMDDDTYEFKGFVYRPDKENAVKMYQSGHHLWNTAYLISTVDYLLSIFKENNEALYDQLEEIYKALDTPEEAEIIKKVYPEIKPIHFDHAVVYHIPKKDVRVLKTDMGWEDPGTLSALKKYIEPSNKNAVQGNVYDYKTKDSLIFNYEKSKLVVASNLDDMIVINTEDALLVTKSDSMGDLGDIVTELNKDDKLKKYC